MSRPKLDFNAIRGVTRDLEPAEGNLSDAIASNAELLATVVRAQRTMNISPSLMHGIITELSGATTDLVSGMGKTVEAHRLLAGMRDRLGIRVVAFGGGMWKGEEGSRGAASAEVSGDAPTIRDATPAAA